MLTIDEIIPEWSKVFDLLQEKKDVKPYLFAHNLDLAKSDRCCVGEAYDFSRGYECEVCTALSYNLGSKHTRGFPYLYFQLINGKVKDWRNSRTVKVFVKHWNESHR